jgi:GH35 family endo-1,4-beta-xylanase
VLQSLAPNGHALLWHNQCPDWFFNDEGRDAGRGNWCFNACEPTYNRRWMVERTIGWLQHFRRLCIRWERSTMMFQGFLHLGC